MFPTFLLNSSTPRKLFWLGLPDVERRPYEMPANDPPRKSVLMTYTSHMGMSTCLITFKYQNTAKPFSHN